MLVKIRILSLFPVEVAVVDVMPCTHDDNEGAYSALDDALFGELVLPFHIAVRMRNHSMSRNIKRRPPQEALLSVEG